MKFFLSLIFSFAVFSLWANSAGAQGMFIPNCSDLAMAQNDQCKWLLAKMEGSLYTGAQTLTGSWSYRYDDYGNPIYIAQKIPNVNFPDGIPASMGFSIYQAKDQPLFNELFELPDPNKPGGFLKTSMELVLFHPAGTPDAGKIQAKIGLIIDASNPQAGGVPHIMVGMESYTYPSANRTEVFRRLNSLNSGQGSLFEIEEYWDINGDGKITKIVKEEEKLGHKSRVDQIDFSYSSLVTQAGMVSAIVHKWSDCSLTPAHCGSNATTFEPELVNGQAQHRISTGTTISGSQGLVGLTIKEYHGEPAGQLTDNTVDKEVACTIGYLQNNQTEIFNLPKILKDLGFATTQVPTGMHCQTNIPAGSTETYDVTFTWVPKWRFSP